MIKGTGESLISRSWLEKIVLNCNSIHEVMLIGCKQFKLSTLKFSNRIGYNEKYMSADPSFPLCFCKARSVSYAMKLLVVAELNKLVKQGILTLVQHAD